MSAFSLFSLGLFTQGESALANTKDSTSPEIQLAETNEEPVIVPYINWSGSAYISKDNWSNITSSNNFFKDSPKITNNSNNPGDLTVRVLNSKGAQVGSSKTVKLGKTVKLDQIPAFSGTYTIQAKSTKAGYHTIKVD